MITVINSFACEPEQQENLVRALRDAAPELGALPGTAWYRCRYIAQESRRDPRRELRASAFGRGL
jgi:hypothetical protein